MSHTDCIVYGVILRSKLNRIFIASHTLFRRHQANHIDTHRITRLFKWIVNTVLGVG